MKEKHKAKAITLYHDGECPLCAFEIKTMQKLDTSKSIAWVDISKDKGELSKAGLSYEDAMARIHVKDENQKMLTGVHAFIAVWSRLPYFRRIASIINSSPFLAKILDYFYTLFAKHRLWLTGRSKSKKSSRNEPN